MNSRPINNNGKGSVLLNHPAHNGESQRGSVYDLITQRIVALLEQGTVPWHKPWKVLSGMPRNLVSKKAYRGVNVLLLHAMNYESPFWLTFKQAHDLGGTIRKGEKACQVVFWKRHQVKDEITGEMERIPLLRYYYVFNASQCDGLKHIPASVLETPTGGQSRAAEMVAAMPNPPEIRHGMRRACYLPSPDIIEMPDQARFDTDAAYHAALFHEMIHSTGHTSRLARPAIMEMEEFGSDSYSKEELVAEIGAAFLCGHAGISDRVIDNSAAYLNGWLEKLKNDRKLIVQAAAQAQRAADYILGVKYEEERDEQPTTE